MQSVLLLLVVCLLPPGAWSQTRTWTFIQDGKMVSDSGSSWSFKKNGRIDAAFVRVDGTNAILLAPAASYRTLPVLSLSQTDRAYLRQAGALPDPEADKMAQAAAAQCAVSRRILEAARFKNEASAQRRLAQLSLEAADKLDNEATRLSARAGKRETHADRRGRAADTLETSRNLSPGATEGYVNSKGDAAIKTAAADNPEQDLVRLRNQAAEKRENAARFQKEAAELERVARSMEDDQMARTPDSH